MAVSKRYGTVDGLECAGSRVAYRHLRLRSADAWILIPRLVTAQALGGICPRAAVPLERTLYSTRQVVAVIPSRSRLLTTAAGCMLALPVMSNLGATLCCMSVL